MKNIENIENSENIENIETPENTKKPKNTKKIVIIAIAALLAVALIVGGILLALFSGKDVVIPADIVKNGEANYTIVIPDNCSNDLMLSLRDLIGNIEDTTGVTLNYVKASEATDTNANYILIGITGFAESGATIESLAATSDAFAIKNVGKHLVFAGQTDIATATAIDYFCTYFIVQKYNAETATLTVNDYIYDGTDALPEGFDASVLPSYTIIYADDATGNKTAAERIQKYIKQLTGKNVDLGSDTATPESPCEILVGKTNRYLSSKCYANGVSLMEYELNVRYGQVQIVSGGSYSAEEGGRALADMLAIDKELTLSAGTHKKASVIKNNSLAWTEGTDFRIMTANILGYSSADKSKFDISEHRAEAFAKVLVDYRPDFIGVQEMDSRYFNALNVLLKNIKKTYGIEYSFVLPKYNGSINGNPIIYRSDKYTLDYENFTVMSYAKNPSNGVYLSGITSAKFTKIDEPTIEIGILSAHWNWHEGDKGEANQSTDSVEMSKVVKYLRDTYPGIYVFSTGDFNSHRSGGHWLNVFLNSIGGEIASSIAEKNGTIVPSFKHQGVYIDHIISDKDTFDVLLHSGVDKSLFELISDHQPVFADIKLTN